jgi:DNA-binding MarR family transcriptional regulator
MPARTLSNTQTPLPGTLGLDDLSFYVGRLYSHYCLVLEDSLRRHGLARCIRPGMGPLMFALLEEDARTLRELGEIADLSPSTITELAQKLEKAGVLRRERCEKDGRAIRVTLTKLGRSLRQPLLTVSREVNGLLHGGLSGGEIKRLKQTLAGMISGLRTFRGESREARATTHPGRLPRNAGKARRR